MAGRNTDAQHLILFDDTCGFCAQAVGFIAPRDRRALFRYSSLEGAEGTRIRAVHALDRGSTGSLLVLPRGTPETVRPLQKSTAVLFIVRHLDGPWARLAALERLPTRLLDWGYDLVARHRHMMAGSAGVCPVPAAATGDKPED